MSGSRRPRGLPLVELMVALAVSMLMVAGAMKAFAAQVNHTRRLLLEARIQQDLRGAAELMSRDLRRAGHWPAQWAAASGTANPYRDLVVEGQAEVIYAYAQDSEGEPHELDSNELHGFRLKDGVLQARDGDSGWQPLTDPAVVNVVHLDIALAQTAQSLGHLCTPACASDDPACPAVAVRSIDVRLRGHATGNADVSREVHERVHVRNDDLPTPHCP